MIDLTMLEQPQLGARCKEIRTELRYTMENVADMAGVTRMSIYNFENGHTQSLDIFRTYYKIAKEGGII